MNGALPQSQDDWQADAELDITRELCPMTFVRTRIALDRLRPGQVLKLRLCGAEPLRNVPLSAAQLGHRELRRRVDAEGVTELLLLRGA